MVHLHIEVGKLNCKPYKYNKSQILECPLSRCFGQIAKTLQMTSWGGNRTLMKGGCLHVIYDVNGEFTTPLVMKMFRSLGLT